MKTKDEKSIDSCISVIYSQTAESKYSLIFHITFVLKSIA